MQIKPVVWALGTATVAGIADWLSKVAAEQFLVIYQPVEVLGSFARLTLNYNTGVAFSLFVDSGRFVLLLTGTLILVLGTWGLRGLALGTLAPRLAIPVGMVLGGALGNFFDRFGDGRVTDYFDVGLGATRWPTFNIADCWIVVGIIVLALLVGRDEQHPESHTNNAAV